MKPRLYRVHQTDRREDGALLIIQRVCYLLNSTPSPRKYEENIENNRTSWNSNKLHTSAGIPCQYRICSVHVPPVYVQFMFLRASVRRYLAGGICHRYCRYMYLSVCRYRYRYRLSYRGIGNFGTLGTTSLPAPETWVSSVRHQYRYRRYRCMVQGTSASSTHLQYRYRTLR